MCFFLLRCDYIVRKKSSSTYWLDFERIKKRGECSRPHVSYGNYDTVFRSRCIKMALVHDMAECIVGDITPWCGISKEEKHQQERDAMDKLCKLAGDQTGQEILELWEEYSQQTTAESKAVKDLDKFDMLLQAFEYEKLLKSPKKLQNFFDNNKGSFNSAEVNNWMEELQNLRTLQRHDEPDGNLPNNGYVKILQE
ncbi:5'-deoxynucleotidase HDDC2 isoform X5 [Tachypleus tridentatus]|uniref:5'-deoxynucleotidase HDDC2 isoform X5 n=1 Tax=Tachypleus tridentatus TaxID=6853 RepID=UPI003FD5DE4C